MLAFDSSLQPDEVISNRIAGALKLRERIIDANTNCYRIVNGDGDGLPGVVVDRYGEVMVVQLLTAGAERMREDLVRELRCLLAPRAIFERSIGAVRRQEGLSDRVGELAGGHLAEAIVAESGVKLAIDFEHGQKTGYFLDQRENRLLAKKIASGARVLDAYCYAGGFALAALAGGAREVVAVDTSARALAWARRHLELNGYAADLCTLVHGDAADYLCSNGREFDLVILDPPPLARSLKDVPRASHLYVELNALAMRAVARRGYLMTFSCSAHFHGDDFIRAIRIAQTRACRKFRVLAHLGPGPDHPVLLGHSEGAYLTGALLADLG